VLLAVLALAIPVFTGVATSAPLPTAPNCAIFPSDNWWNVRVDSLPVAANSNAILSTIGLSTGLHPDFGSGLWNGSPIGIPITTVAGTQAKVNVAFTYASESDAGPYPIPSNVQIEGGSDRHALIVDRDHCKLYELYALQKKGKQWKAGSGAIWSLSSNALRPAGWTSADAAGLPILRIYRTFGSKQAILRGLYRRVDEATLAEPPAAEPAERPRDRLFDLLMRRFDTLRPHKPALEVLRRELPADPMTVLCAGAWLLRSMRWMLEAADISTAGLRGALAVKLTGAAYLSTMRVWQRDDSPDLARTMAALDARLRRIEGCFVQTHQQRDDERLAPS